MNITKYKIKISSIDFNNNHFIIRSDNGQIFESKIKKGSVDFKIFNQHDQEVNLSNLESGDLIQIFGMSKPNDQILKLEDDNNINELVRLIGGSNIYINNSKLEKKDQKNSIIIKKIIIRNKYVFTSETSEEFDSYN